MAQAEVDKLLKRAYKFANDTWARKGLDKSKQRVTVTRANLRNAFKEAFSKEHAKQFKRAKNPFMQDGKIDNKPFDNAVDAAFKALLAHLKKEQTLSDLNTATKNKIVFDQPRALKTPFTTLKNAGIKQINKELKARGKKELSDRQKLTLKTGVERLHTDTTVGMARLAYTLEQLEKNSITAKFFAGEHGSKELQSLKAKYGDVTTQYEIKKIKGKKQIRYKGEVSLYLDRASKNFAGSEHNDWKKVRPKLEKALTDWLVGQGLADLEGSVSPTEDYKREAVSEVLNKFKTVKKAKIKRKTAQPVKKTKRYRPRKEKAKVPSEPKVVAAQIAKDKRKSRQENAGGANTMQMLGVLNEKLPETVRQNMKDPGLINRTGRFANSVRITDMGTTPRGFPSIGYTYDRDNYGQYEMSSGSRFSDPNRDPRVVIDRSIREIAAGLAIGRFFTRRV